jgi:hypothetical protein
MINKMRYRFNKIKWESLMKQKNGLLLKVIMVRSEQSNSEDDQFNSNYKLK